MNNPMRERPEETQNRESYHHEQGRKALLSAAIFILSVIVVICGLALRFGGK